MARNGLIEDARAIRTLPAARRGPTLINFVKAQNGADQKAIVFDLLERREIPRTLDAGSVQILASAAGVAPSVVEEGFELTVDGVARALQAVTPPSSKTLDPIAKVAAGKTRTEFDTRLAAYPKPRLAQRGITGTVEKVTGRLNARDLDDARRLVLAQPSVYELLFLTALDDGQIPNDDAAGITDYILTHIDLPGEALLHFLRGVVDAVLVEQRITLDDSERNDVAALAITRGLDLRRDRLTAAVLALIDVRRRQGNTPRFVDYYLSTQEISPEAVDESIRQAMIEYLLPLDVQMTFEGVVAGRHDEWMSAAYINAREQRTASDDPIDIARSGRKVASTSDFSIRRVSERETTLVRPRAILAAGALFSIYVEGELMRLFDIADALSLEWHRGSLDVSEGDVAALLNRMEHLRDDRPGDEERGMLYRRLFNYGEAEMLSGTLVNERFGEHFDRLMYEVTRFVDLQDRAFSDPRQISRAGISSAIVALQQNLGQFVTGSAFTKIEELLSYLNEAQDLITSAPIVARYGGIEQSVTSAIKNMGLQFLEASLPVDRLFELAEHGNDVFSFVAEFQRGNIREEPFQEFLDAAQQTIMARAAIDDGAWQPPSHDYRRHRPHRRHDDDEGSAGRNGRTPVPAVIDDWDR
jgi:hypothetical protein